MEGDAKFSGLDINPVFNKFKLDGSDEMNPSFFPNSKLDIFFIIFYLWCMALKSNESPQ